jgi:tetratricopeptide (TPR) repeat protein
MQWKHVFLVIGLLVLLLVLLLIIPSSQLITMLVKYWVMGSVPATPAATPDAVLEQANTVMEQVRSTVDVMNLIVAVLALVLAFMTVGVAVLGFLGFSTIREVRTYQQQWRTQMEDLHKDIDTKKNTIDTLQTTIEQKGQVIDGLHRRLEDLALRMEEKVNTLTIEADKTWAAASYLILGNQLREQRKIEQAIESFEQAHNLRPRDAQINYHLALAYRENEQYDQAIARFLDALEANPAFPQAQMELGMTYRYRGDARTNPQQRQNDYEKAVEHLHHALNLRNNYWEALGTLGGLYRRLRNYKKALEYYRRASAVDATTSYGPGNIAILYWHEGKREEARKEFELTAQLARERIAAGRSQEPYWDYYDLALAQLVLGSLEGDTGKQEEALKTYEEAIQRTTSRGSFDGVLSVLSLLREVEKEHPIVGLEMVIKRIEQAKAAFLQA